METKQSRTSRRVCVVGGGRPGQRHVDAIGGEGFGQRVGELLLAGLERGLQPLLETIRGGADALALVQREGGEASQQEREGAAPPEVGDAPGLERLIAGGGDKLAQRPGRALSEGAGAARAHRLAIDADQRHHLHHGASEERLGGGGGEVAGRYVRLPHRQPLFAGKLKDGLSRDPRQRPGTDTRREQLPVAYEEDVARGTLSDEAAAIQEDRLAGAAAPRLLAGQEVVEAVERLHARQG